MKFKKRYIVGGIFAVIGIGLAGFIVANPRIDIAISKQTIQSVIDKKLPLTGSKLSIDYVVREVAVNLHEGTGIGVVTDVDAVALGRRVDFQAEASANLEYRAGAFYLTDVVIKDVHIAEGPGADPESKTSKVLKSLSGGGAEEVSPIKSKVLEIASDVTNHVLAGTPVYTLKGNFTQSMVRLALQDVKVTEAGVIATLDPMTFVMRIAMMIAAGILTLGAVVAIFASGSVLGIVGLGVFAAMP